MAYDDSEALQPNSTYSLGGYTFELKVQTVHEPGEEDVVSVFAICHSPDGTRETVPKDFPAGTTVEGWYVEANETEASVYIVEKSHEGESKTSTLDTGNIQQPIPSGSLASISGDKYQDIEPRITEDYSADAILLVSGDTGASMRHFVIAASAYPNKEFTEVVKNHVAHDETTRTHQMVRNFTYNGKTVYYSSLSVYGVGAITSVSGPHISPFREPDAIEQVAWTMVYGTPSGDGKTNELLVARFAIDLRDADGGPDGDWDDPGDVGPDPEKHFTLTVSVTGASVGSNSGIPLEAQEQSVYGSGGYGGNGGGGGAGASTVIIYDFATDKADNVVQEATAQGPGAGGPGGKGGKGGDGCILIFY